MSGGASGLGGYIYQQDYVFFRVLASVAVSDRSASDQLRRVQSYAIEGRTTPEGAVWDVRLGLSEPDVIELRECKNTRITNEDRRTFYRRLRQEHASGTIFHRLTAGWVTDLAKQGNSKILDHLKAMRRLAREGTPAPPLALPKQVNSGKSALQEALFILSSEASSDDSPAVPIDVARELLSRLDVVLISSVDLKNAVETIAEEVLPQGTGPSIRPILIGNLTDKITIAGHAEGTVEEILAEVGGTAVIARVRDGLRKFLRDHSAASPLPMKNFIRWEQLQAKSVEWTLATRLPGFALDRSCMIVGPQGSGKTTAFVQAIHEQTKHRGRHHVLWVDAGLFQPEFIRRLPGFVAILCGLSPTWIAIDGLDRVGSDQRKDWEDCLGRLLSLPGLILMATAREEVLTSGEWLQRLTTSLPSLQLEMLRDEQVRNEFRRAGLAEPTAPDLLRVLRNPLLLSLYASIADKDSLPLGSGGRITAFRVVQEFWKRRVKAPSEGHRLIGIEDDSPPAKRLAIAHLVNETLEGSLTMSLPDTGSAVRGIQMLAREGVVIEQGTHAVRWYHEWIREYALVDFVIRKIQQVGGDRLAGQICEIGLDHVARTAAVAGAKWVITEEIWGPVEAYLAALHERNKGYASEALAALLEESPAHLKLDDLADPLLLEAIGMARHMRAKPWSEQITSLSLDRFRGEVGGQLLRAVNLYDFEMASNE